MNTRLLTLSLSLLAATLPVAPVRADDAVVTLQRPLNLSLPRETRPLPSVNFDGTSVDPVERNLRSTQIRDGRNVERLPYGSGYEARQRGSGQGSGQGSGPGAGQGSGQGSGQGNGTTGSGGGGRGRGGMGRGR